MLKLALLTLPLLLNADPPAQAPTPLDVVSAVETAMADAIAKAEDSVVAIAREKSDNEETLAIRGTDPGRTNDPDNLLNGLPPRGLASPDELSLDYGSGVVIGDKGEILTAFHVVKGARTLRVRATGRQAFDAEIIAADSRSDLAVIVPKTGVGRPAPKLKPIALGDSSKLRKGSFLVALGNPFNAAKDGKPSASWGILANVARRIERTFEEQRELQLRNYPTLLQLDSKLNLGMSGGAVINMKGELVGLTTGAANVMGFDAQAGYAIPMDKLGRQIAETLKQGKEYEYGFLGIKLDVDNNTNKVGSADTGSPASEGGILIDDLIEAVGDIPVFDRDSLVIAINSVPAGETVRFKIRRRNSLIERDVKLAKLKVRSEVIATNRPNPWRGIRVDYSSTMATSVFAQQLTEALARQGVLITEVQLGSEADQAGLKVGQLITKIDGTPVKNPRDFAKVVSAIKGPARVDTEAETVTVK